MKNESSVFLDLRAAANLLGIPLWTVRGLVWSGQLPARKIGRRLYLRRTDVLNWANGKHTDRHTPKREAATCTT